MSRFGKIFGGQDANAQTLCQNLWRRVVAATLCLLFLWAASILLVYPRTAFAQETIAIYINGEQVYPDVAPYIYQYRTMVPLRLISEKMGYTCTWDNIKKEVFIQNAEKSLYLWPGKSEGLYNGQAFACDVAPQVAAARVMVPLRLVSEAMGAQVDYASATKTVYIVSDAFSATVEDVEQADQALSSRLMVLYDVVNLRQGPGTEYPVVGQVKQGDVLLATDKSGDWYQVEEGYVRQDLVYLLDGDSLSRSDEDALAGKVIVLDPGHGKISEDGSYSDPGAIGPSGLREREVNLAVTAYAVDFLRRMGAQVITTNMGDNYLSLADRAAYAAYYDADIFVSIHANANTSAAVSGSGVYRNSASVNAYLDNLLGRKIEDSLVASLERREVGVVAGAFGVLRDLSCPGVIVEVAFLSNPEEEALLASDEFRQKAAMAIAYGIRDYFAALSS